MGNSISTLMNKKVDGIIIAAVSINDNYVSRVYESGFPIMLCIRNIDGRNINSVEVDNFKGSELAVKHLVELGHKQISFIAGPDQFSTSYGRYQGYKHSLNSYGLDYNESLVFKGDFKYENISSYIDKILDISNPPTAIFVSSDQLAFAVLEAINLNGLKIPQDISVISFDDISISSNPYIGLTTISQSKTEMATIALTQLIKIIEGELTQLPVQITLEPKLIIRKTTAQPSRL
jgi:LacI family transcriptional regulator